MINGIGGIQVLFPLLEQVNKGPLPDTDSLPQPVDPGVGMDPMQEQDDWVVVPSSSYSGTHSQVIIKVILSCLKDSKSLITLILCIS